jgi:Helicase associated domain
MNFDWGDTLAVAASAPSAMITTNRGWGGDRRSASHMKNKKTKNSKTASKPSPPKPDRPTSSSSSGPKRAKAAAPKPDRCNSSRATATTGTCARTATFAAPIRTGLIPFETRLMHIKRYKLLHGHTKVPWGYQGFHRLGRFVYRLKYKRFILQNLDLDQFQALEGIDFDWSFKHLGKTYCA